MSNANSNDMAVQVTQSMAAQGKGVLIAIETLAEDKGDCRTQILKLSADGSKPKAQVTQATDVKLTETGVPPMANFGGRDPLATAWNTGKAAELVDLGKDAVQIAAGEAKGYFAALSDDGTYVAALGETRGKAGLKQALYFAKSTLKAPKFKSIDVKPLGLGDQRVVTAIAVWKSALYVAVADTMAGCDVFRVDLGGRKLALEPVFERGGFRFSLNAAVPCFLATEEALLFGTAALATSAPRVGRWGAELIALDDKGGWELLFGQQRFTPIGLKRAASGQGAGFGSNDNSAVQALARGPGKKGRVFVALQGYRGENENDRRVVRPDMFAYDGKLRVLASVTGKGLSEWELLEVALPPSSGAVTGMVATAEALVIGHECLGTDTVPYTVVPLK